MKAKTVSQEKKEIEYNKIVNVAEDGEITVLDYTFEYPDGIKGATGSKFYPVSKADFDEQVTFDNIVDYLMESGDEVPEQYKKGGFNEWAKAIIDAGEQANVFWDQSYSELWPYLRKALNLSEEDAYIFNCQGGGRCFDKEFKGNFNKKLSAIIRKAEGGK